jgi:hypothetical protein
MQKPANPVGIVALFDPPNFVDLGSAIVCALSGSDLDIGPSGLVTIYFESNRYGAVNLETFPERVRVAASRLVSHLPTVARALVPATSLRLVGTYDYEAHRIDVTDPATLTLWAGEQAVIESRALF